VHPVLLFALAPERRADVTDSHRLGDPRSPAVFELRAESRLATAGLASDEKALDARSREVEASVGSGLDESGGIGGGEDDGFRLQELEREQQTLARSGSDRDVADPDSLQPVEGGARHERACVVRAEETLAGRDSGSRVAPRR